jgi:hypothetical protein
VNRYPPPTGDDDPPLTDMERGLVRLLVLALMDEFLEDLRHEQQPDAPRDAAVEGDAGR